MNPVRTRYQILIDEQDEYVILDHLKHSESALETLTKIEQVINENLQYCANFEDDFSKLKDSDLLTELRSIAHKIHDGWIEKDSNRYWFTKKLFPTHAKKTAIDNMYSRIESSFEPYIETVPPEIFNLILGYLPKTDAENLVKANIGLAPAVGASLIDQARQKGYVGENTREARSYLENLDEESDIFFAYIPERHLVFKPRTGFFKFFKKKQIDQQRTLENIKNWSSEEIFRLFSRVNIYNSCPTFIKYFALLAEETIVSPYNEDLTKALALDEALLQQHELAKLLLRHGANPNENGPSFLKRAVRSGDLDLVICFLDNGAIIDVQDSQGRTPLAIAAVCNEDMACLLLERGADPSIPIGDGEEGTTPLHIAAAYGHNKLIEKILETQKVPIDARDGNGLTPLMQICIKAIDIPLERRKQTVELLVQYGANPRLSGEGRNALQFAAESGFSEIVELLLKDDEQHQNHINEINKRSDRNALMKACESKDSNGETIESLLKLGATPNVLNSKGWGALHLAIMKGDERAVQLLCNYGCDVNLKELYGNTPLILACENGNKKIVQMLLEHHADPNIADKYERTPLIYAAHLGEYKILQHLLENDAHVNYKDLFGRTALFYACDAEKNSDKMVDLLLIYEANPNYVDENGLSPLNYAANQKDDRVVKLLTENPHHENLKAFVLDDSGSGTKIPPSLKKAYNINGIPLLKNVERLGSFKT